MQAFSLGLTAREVVTERLARLQAQLESAAAQGCFSLEVPLDASMGSPQW